VGAHSLAPARAADPPAGDAHPDHTHPDHTHPDHGADPVFEDLNGAATPPRVAVRLPSGSPRPHAS